jgi:hypothetical protein
MLQAAHDAIIDRESVKVKLGRVGTAAPLQSPTPTQQAAPPAARQGDASRRAAQQGSPTWMMLQRAPSWVTAAAAAPRSGSERSA